MSPRARAPMIHVKQGEWIVNARAPMIHVKQSSP
jgi:hypothetical protein